MSYVKVYCQLEQCIYQNDETGECESPIPITLYENHDCYGGCDDGWKFPPEEEEEE